MTDRLVAAFMARSRVQALITAGMLHPRIAAAAGTSPYTIQDLCRGRRACLHWSLVTRIFAITGTTVRPRPSRRHVPDVGTGRRLRALLAMGWRLRDLAAAGVDPALVTDTPGWVPRDTHQRVCRVYDELGMRPGPCPAWRDRARAAGCLTALAWDDELLDDPDADPDAYGPDGEVIAIDAAAVLRRVWGERIQLTEAEAAEAVRIMRRRGLSHTEIERHAGLNVSRYQRAVA